MVRDDGMKDATERIIDMLFEEDAHKEGDFERLTRRVEEAIVRIDGRLAPLAHRTPSHPLAPRYRIGIMGWVDAADWDAAFDGEPEWAHAAYMLQLNTVMDARGIAMMLLAVGAEGLRATLDALFDRTPERMRWCHYCEADNRPLAAPGDGPRLIDVFGPACAGLPRPARSFVDRDETVDGTRILEVRVEARRADGSGIRRRMRARIRA